MGNSIFLLVLISILLLLNSIFVFRVSARYRRNISRIQWTIILVLTLFGPVSLRLSRGTEYSDLISSVFYFWLGFLAVALNGIIVFELGNLVSKGVFHHDLKGVLSGTIMVFIILIGSGFAIWNALAIQTKETEIPITNLKTESKILYLSDIHISHKSDLLFLRKIIDKLNAIEADFVIINGDFIDGEGLNPEDLKILNTINKEVFFTLGNHESYAGNAYVKSLLQNTKIRLLENEKTFFKQRELIGLADMHGFDNEDNHEILNQTLSNLLTGEQTKPRLLILHEPIGPRIAEIHGINLQVAGHTHNGQIFPFTLFVKFAFPYIKGLYTFDTNTLFVSSGIGTRGPTMRLGSRSELVILKLIPKQ